MLKKILNVVKKIKLRKKINTLNEKLLNLEIDLADKAITECEDFVTTINEYALKINKDYQKLYSDFLKNVEKVNEKEDELKYYFRDFNEKHSEYKSSLILLTTKLKNVMKEIKSNREKYRVRMEKEKEIQKRFRVLTMFHDKDMNKTLTNLAEAFVSHEKEKNNFETEIAKLKTKIKKIEKDKNLNIEKTYDSLKNLNKTKITAEKKLKSIKKERDVILADVGKKIVKHENLPESLSEQKKIILELKEEIDNIQDEIILL